MSQTKRKPKPGPTTNSAALPEVLTLAEAAAYLRVPDQQLLDVLASGACPGQKVGTEWRFFKPALQAWLGSSARQRNGILAHVGALKDDPHAEEMLQEIYKQRGRPMTEEG